MTTKHIKINHVGGEAFYNICNEMHLNTHSVDHFPLTIPPSGCLRTNSMVSEIKKLKHYVHRRDLSIQDVVYSDPSPRSRVIVVHGNRGTGKTSLCRAFARDVVWYVSV